MTDGPLVVIGDALLDRDVRGRATRLCPDAPAPVLDEIDERERPGGAALAAVFASIGNRETVLVTHLSNDTAGRRLATLIESFGVRLISLPMAGSTTEKVRFLAGPHVLLRWDRGDPPPPYSAALPENVTAAIGQAAAILVSDYGRGLTRSKALREALTRQAHETPLVWDPHPRGSAPVAGSFLVTPNSQELLQLDPAGASGDERDLPRITSCAAAARDRWKVDGVAVTLGERGAVLCEGASQSLLVPAPPIQARDACGAGDYFAATVARAAADGEKAAKAVFAGVSAAYAYVEADGPRDIANYSVGESGGGNDQTGPAKERQW
ncbi:MAG: bifunctional heptose 7-phosphate kinase/heptose 1-phosphate adenyltransferase [Mycobacteriales bacterium]